MSCPKTLCLNYDSTQTDNCKSDLSELPRQCQKNGYNHFVDRTLPSIIELTDRIKYLESVLDWVTDGNCNEMIIQYEILMADYNNEGE